MRVSARKQTEHAKQLVLLEDHVQGLNVGLRDCDLAEQSGKDNHRERKNDFFAQILGMPDLKEIIHEQNFTLLLPV